MGSTTVRCCPIWASPTRRLLSASLRWRPPQAPRSWAETYDADKSGNACVQNADLGAFATAGGSEDCLYLNVYLPRAAVQARKPLRVFVWIHGGSLWVGQGSDYDPRKLALDGEAVVVSLNYRLGMFGFFAHPAIDGEGHPFANYGQMDQIFALDWVKRNIAAFGGDPNNIAVRGNVRGSQRPGAGDLALVGGQVPARHRHERCGPCPEASQLRCGTATGRCPEGGLGFRRRCRL